MRTFRALGVLLALLIGLPVSAQVVTSSTGAINGVVTDTSKAVLPGVTITAQSPNLMGTRETVSDAEGRYQFAAIPPGDYTLTFDLPGFSKFIREGIRIGLMFTGTVNVEMQLATQQETITVTGQSPVVDTQSTKITNNFDERTMSALPTARDLPSLMMQTPGVTMDRVDVGGSAALNQNTPKIYGMSAGAGISYIRTEGIVASGQTNQYNDFGAFDEVQIETAAHTAEMPFAGLYSNMITKSGGNAYHGSFYKDYESKAMGSTNIDDRQIALGVSGGPTIAAKDTNKVEDLQDTNIGIGGYVKKDRLWWFGSMRENTSHIASVAYPSAPALQRLRSGQAKITYNQTANHKFIGYLNRNNKYMPAYGFSTSDINSANSPSDEDYPVGQLKIEYNAVLSPSVFLEVRGGKHFKTMSNFSRDPWSPRYVDNTLRTIDGSRNRNISTQFRPQMSGSLSYFKRGWGTSHNFKVGWEVAQQQDEETHVGYANRQGPINQPDIQYILNNGVPTQVTYTLSGYHFTYQWWHSAYLNDSWQLNDHLSFNLGFRWDRYQNGYPETIQPRDQFGGMFVPVQLVFPENTNALRFDSWGPRLGVVWNVKGNGKTLVKANFGNYGTRPGVTLANPALVPWTRTLAWTDRNGDLLWQAGEEGRTLDAVGGTGTADIDPNWKLATTMEFATWLERELFADFGVRTGFVFRRNDNPAVTLNPDRPLSAYNVPVSICVPNERNVVTDPVNCQRLTVYDLDPQVLALPIRSWSTHNNLIPDEHFTTWEVSGTKRMSNRWSMNASYVITWSARSNGTATAIPTNPNALIGASDDNLFHFTTSNAKLSSTIQLPFDVSLAEILRHQSGNPYGRTISVRRNYGNQTVQVEPMDARTTDAITILDIRVEKGLSLGGSRRLGFFFDVFNVFNSNGEQSIIQSSGATFLRPTTIIAPRVGRVGVKFDW